MYGEDKSPERHSIHGNSPSPIRHRGNMGGDMMIGSHSTTASTTSSKKHHREGAMPIIGNNIDGIPLGNRSPPRNNNNSAGSNKNENSQSPNMENMN